MYRKENPSKQRGLRKYYTHTDSIPDPFEVVKSFVRGKGSYLCKKDECIFPATIADILTLERLQIIDACLSRKDFPYFIKAYHPGLFDRYCNGFLTDDEIRLITEGLQDYMKGIAV